MPRRDPPIATVPLARSISRLAGPPLLAAVMGLVALAAGIVLLPGLAGVAVAVLGAATVLLGIASAAILLSVRVDVEEAAVRVRRLGGERRYELVPGPVTRVRLRGEDASRLRATRSLPGWQLGPARLREEENVEVVRMGPTDTAILVPTDRGRLAVAAADERVLLAALAEAAKARQRLAELTADDAGQATEDATPGVAVAVPPGPDPVEMTGIERARWESEQAALREAAELDAAERAAAERNAAPRADAAVEGETVAAAVPITTTADSDARAEEVAGPNRRGIGRRLPLRRPHPSTALVVLPLAGAGVAWGIGLILGRMPDPQSELGRLTALALVLTGPAATIGAIMARVWWPRLVAVVVAAGLAGAVFVGRSLVGG